MPAFSSVTTLQDALRVNYVMGLAGPADVGGKVAALISQITILQSNLTAIQSAIVSANASGATFSATSAGTFTAFATITNFAST